VPPWEYHSQVRGEGLSRTLVIAECGSSWDCDIQKAFRLIDAAKACGADIAKFQWTSNAKAMAERRLGANAARSIEMYRKYLEYPFEILTRLKAHCDSVGIEFLVTAYLIEDIATIAPLVKRFKVSAFEARWVEFVRAHVECGKEIIVSKNKDDAFPQGDLCKRLLCVSNYPTKLEDLKLSRLSYRWDWMGEHEDTPWYHGLSDHTTSTLTGALAVAAGATIIEKHIRLIDTAKDCPDYGHSLIATPHSEHRYFEEHYDFSVYVANIREAERAL
jgi:N,N'-diacetyllegionaminate synthase